ncbi:MAG: 16S rRNA (cytosine(967)-C(5))-methyltransferase RsmB, partial [Bacteroidota bacterium]
DALRLLARIRDGAYADRLDPDGSALDNSDTGDARASGQAVGYAAGVTRHRRWLDFLLAHLYHGNPATLEPDLRDVLRLGLFDLFVEQTPPHAAVNESVALARAAVNPGAAKLVNAILRTADRRRDALPEPDTGKAARDLAVRHSHPTWLVRRWLARFGTGDTEALLLADNAPPTYSLRLNTQRHSIEDGHAMLTQLGHDLGAEQGFDWEPSPYLDDFVRVERLQPVVRAGGLADGTWAVQDEAAGLVVRLLDPQPGETIRDIAAAPGGKALYAALRMGDEGRVFASDPHVTRTGLIERAAAAHGLTSVETQAISAQILAAASLAETPDIELADRVLLDAPCSGTGVLAKRADLRWRRTLDDLGTLVALQDELLDAAAALVKPGGVLVYATCSIEPEENAERVRRFLAERADFALEDAAPYVPTAMRTEEGYYAALPHVHGTDGAFGARLRKAA